MQILLRHLSKPETIYIIYHQLAQAGIVNTDYCKCPYPLFSTCNVSKHLIACSDHSGYLDSRLSCHTPSMEIGLEDLGLSGAVM